MAGYLFEVLEVLKQPDAIHRGSAGELIATRELEAGQALGGRLQRSNQGGWICDHCLLHEEV